MVGFYLLNDQCINPCGTGYIQYDVTRTCEVCATFCIDVNINIYFPSSGSYNEQVYIDMVFSKDLDFATFDQAGFQTVTISGVEQASYALSYSTLTSNSYRITVSLVGYIFLYNETVSVTTKTQPDPVD